MRQKKDLSIVTSDKDEDISDEEYAQRDTTLNLDLPQLFPSIPTSSLYESDVQLESDSNQVELMPYMSYGTMTLSDVVEPTSVGLQPFPAHLEAGKQIGLHNLPKLDLTKCFHPFRNAMDYKLARYFHSAHVPLTKIDEFFKEGFYQPPEGGDPTKSIVSFNFAYTLCKLWDEMTQDPQWKNGFVDFKIAQNTEFWYRDIVKCIRYLLRRKSYAQSMFWEPVREFDDAGEGVYTELNTGLWWWETQVLCLLIELFMPY